MRVPKDVWTWSKTSKQTNKIPPLFPSRTITQTRVFQRTVRSGPSGTFTHHGAWGINTRGEPGLKWAANERQKKKKGGATLSDSLRGCYFWKMKFARCRWYFRKRPARICRTQSSPALPTGAGCLLLLLSTHATFTSTSFFGEQQEERYKSTAVGVWTNTTPSTAVLTAPGCSGTGTLPALPIHKLVAAAGEQPTMVADVVDGIGVHEVWSLLFPLIDSR